MSEALHPFSPRALFVLGHHAQWCGAYFQRVLLAARLGQHPDDAVARYQQGLVGALREEATHVGALVTLADTLARAHGFEIPAPPRTPDAWDPWAQAIARAARGRLDLTTPVGAPFTFGWELGQVRTTLAALVTTGEIIARGLDLRATLDAGVKDLAAASRRWPSSALLLAQLPGGREVLDVWRPAFDEVAHLGRSHVGAADAAGLQALARGARGVLEGLATVEEVATGKLAAG